MCAMHFRVGNSIICAQCVLRVQHKLSVPNVPLNVLVLEVQAPKEGIGVGVQGLPFI